MRTNQLHSLSITAVIITLAGLTPHAVQAAAGDIDPSFGRAGAMLTDFGKTDDYGFAVKVQADGKIVVAGESGVYPLFHSAPDALQRKWQT